MAQNIHSVGPDHFESTDALRDHVRNERLGFVDAREWGHDWAERWVVYADLIAFAERAIRSEHVVLNNILRFDRACTLVANRIHDVSVRRFSDATFAVAATFQRAMAFGVALSHVCLAFNREYLDRAGQGLFIHMVAPRITIARGRLLLSRTESVENQRYDGNKPQNILAGSAIVRAYRLERESAGGLLTVGKEAIEELGEMRVRSGRSKVLSRWLAKLGDADAIKSGKVFFHRDQVLDIPWLLMRPLQDDPERIVAAERNDAVTAITSFLKVWDTSVREFYSTQNCAARLDVSKHAQAAIRHGVQCYQVVQGRAKPQFGSASDVISDVATRR